MRSKWSDVEKGWEISPKKKKKRKWQSGGEGLASRLSDGRCKERRSFAWPAALHLCPAPPNCRHAYHNRRQSFTRSKGSAPPTNGLQTLSCALKCLTSVQRIRFILVGLTGYSKVDLNNWHKTSLHLHTGLAYITTGQKEQRKTIKLVGLNLSVQFVYELVAKKTRHFSN